jgi:nitrate reductase gamma subunit
MSYGAVGDNLPEVSFINLPVSNQLIDAGGLIVLLLVVLGIAYKMAGGSLHHFLHWDVFPLKGKVETKHSYKVPSFFAVLLREIFAFRVLESCSKTKRISHFAIFWGFVFLAISTTLAFLTNPTNLVLPLLNPVKIFGNVGGALVVVGFAGIFYVRYREEEPVWKLTRSDIFLVTIFLAVVTGFITQQATYSSLGSEWVSSTFWIHMIFVIILLATAPFTKFFHAISKPISLLYEEIFFL